MPEAPEHVPWAAIACKAAGPMPPDIAALRDGGEPVWIFAYGSLMWNPEIACAEARPALLRGYHRSFCLYSYDYRGSRERPGLVLGLDRGGACWGMALRLDGKSLAASLDRIWTREMSGGGVYEMRRLAVQAVGLQPTDLIRGGAALSAHAFVVRRDHPDYAGFLPLDERARMILAASGHRGTCRDYFATTLCHLDRLGLVDRPLRRLAQRIEALAPLTSPALQPLRSGAG
ncbi:MAG TPA: gamma-glutamylcyclotransferase [Stellaceae bacterium]|nr:gamma-glutamylcyclotransferase [Stellaceae bacterium]